MYKKLQSYGHTFTLIQGNMHIYASSNKQTQNEFKTIKMKKDYNRKLETYTIKKIQVYTNTHKHQDTHKKLQTKKNPINKKQD